MYPVQDHLFVHDGFSRQICPEAQGHFCMLLGDHGHGGYDSHANAYIQGGQLMDDQFEIIALYDDFAVAREEMNWRKMRSLIAELRSLRFRIGVTQVQEHQMRKDDAGL